MSQEIYLVYVEDDEDDLMLMEEIMNRQKEINFIGVGDGQQLLHFLEGRRGGNLPCLIILDNNTPRMSGIETARVIKNDGLFRQLPLVLLTTAPSRNDEAFCRDNNISVFTKPATFPEWEALSESFLQHCRSF